MAAAVSPDRWFYSGFALALVVIVAAGFTPTFYARGWYSAGSSLPVVVQLHGALGTTWVAQRRVAARHKRLMLLAAVEP